MFVVNEDEVLFLLRRVLLLFVVECWSDKEMAFVEPHVNAARARGSKDGARC